MKSLFLSMISEKMYAKRYSKRTIQSYLRWIAAFIRFNDFRHPKELGDKEVEEYLSFLVNKKDVAANTQRNALNALAYLYREILNEPLSHSLDFVKSHRMTKLPAVLTEQEIRRFFQHCPAHHHLGCSLMYGSGLRLMETVRLRVKDIYPCYFKMLVSGRLSDS